jgi:hypothetical protein
MDILKTIKSLFSIVDRLFQNAHDSDQRKIGAQEAELKKRDEADRIREEADEHRKKTSNDSNVDISRRL